MDLSLDAYGCYIILKIYNLYDERDKETFANILIDELETLTNDQNGFKTVKKILFSFDLALLIFQTLVRKDLLIR
jgi:hypothetical protein